MRGVFDTKDFPDAVIKGLESVDILLDIGCGIRPQQLIRPAVHICCEPFAQYADKLLHMTENLGGGQLPHDRHYIVVRAGWAEAIKLFPSQSVDTVCLLDVIEHLKKDEGRELLQATEALARRQLVLFTPLGFMPQDCSGGKDGWGLDGADWQQHKSGWTPDDFDASWDTYTFKNFHTTDHLGKPLEKPFDAFFAVKKIQQRANSNSTESKIKPTRRQSAHILVDEALNLVSGLRRR